MNIMIEAINSKEKKHDYVGTIHNSIKNELSSILSRINPAEMMNRNNLDLENGGMKILMIKNPADLEIRNELTNAPILVVHTYKNSDKLIENLNTIKRLGNVSYFGKGSTSILRQLWDLNKGNSQQDNYDKLARKINCSSFMVDSVSLSLNNFQDLWV
jgi:hypothetical protein